MAMLVGVGVALALAWRPAAEAVWPVALTVIDGDTVDARWPWRRERVRIVGMDAPEVHSPRCAHERAMGERASARLKALVSGARTIRLMRVPRRDVFGRTLARVMIDGRDVAEIAVDQGWARRYGGGKRGGWCDDK